MPVWPDGNHGERNWPIGKVTLKLKDSWKFVLEQALIRTVMIVEAAPRAAVTAPVPPPVPSGPSRASSQLTKHFGHRRKPEWD